MGRPKEWTPKMDAAIATGRANGLTAAEIGAGLGKTTSAVMARAYALKLPALKKQGPTRDPDSYRQHLRNVDASWTDDRVDELKRLWAEGKSATEIAGELGGITRNSVIGKVARLKLQRRNVNMAHQRRAAIPTPKRMGAHAAGGTATKLRRLLSGPPKVAAPIRVKPLPADLPTFGTVSFIDQHSGQCKFPMWTNRDRLPPDQLMVCGRPIEGDGSPYCGAHGDLCFAERVGARNKGFAIRQVAA